MSDSIGMKYTDKYLKMAMEILTSIQSFDIYDVQSSRRSSQHIFKNAGLNRNNSNRQKTTNKKKKKTVRWERHTCSTLTKFCVCCCFLFVAGNKKKSRNAPFHRPTNIRKSKSFFFLLNFYDIAWPALWTRMDRSHIDETEKKKYILK